MMWHDPDQFRNEVTAGDLTSIGHIASYRARFGERMPPGWREEVGPPWPERPPPPPPKPVHRTGPAPLERLALPGTGRDEDVLQFELFARRAR